MGGRREGRGGEREGREKGREGEGGTCSKVLGGGDRRPCREIHRDEYYSVFEYATLAKSG